MKQGVDPQPNAPYGYVMIIRIGNTFKMTGQGGRSTICRPGLSDTTSIKTNTNSQRFVNDIDSKIICRYKIQGIVVDVMPTSREVLGFTNRWYEEGFKYTMEKDLRQNVVIKLFEPSYFLASK